MMHIVPCVIVTKWNDASNVVPFRLSFKDKHEFISFFFFLKQVGCCLQITILSGLQQCLLFLKYI